MSDLSERFALAVAQAPREYVIAVFARALGLSIEEARRRLDEAMQPGTLTLQELMGPPRTCEEIRDQIRRG